MCVENRKSIALIIQKLYSNAKNFITLIFIQSSIICDGPFSWKLSHIHDMYMHVHTHMGQRKHGSFQML